MPSKSAMPISFTIDLLRAKGIFTFVFSIRKRIEEQNEPFKLEILASIPPDQTIAIYHIGSQWWDICAGPHLESTGQINAAAVELLSVAGAYWKGDERNAMMQVPPTPPNPPTVLPPPSACML